MKNQAKEDVQKESQRLGNASGSKDLHNYDEEDPEATHPPKGK